MATYFTRFVALAAAVAPVFGAPAPAPHHLKIRNPEATEVVPDSYIVVYNDNVDSATVASHIESVSSMLSRRDLTGIGATYDMAELKGYQVTADEAAIAEIAASPDVIVPCLLVDSTKLIIVGCVY